MNRRTRIALELLEEFKVAYVTWQATTIDGRRKKDRQFYIHWNTAEALVNRGLAKFSEDPEGFDLIELVEAG